MPDKFSFQNPDVKNEDSELDFDGPAATTTADSAAWRAHRQMTRFLERQTPQSEAGAFSLETVSGTGNVVGVGIGPAEPDSSDWLAEPGTSGLRVYLIEPMAEDEVRRLLRQEMGVEDADDQALPIKPVVTGEITALSHRIRHRPAFAGLSICHHLGTAGTLGCIVRGRSGDRRGRTLVLSNNHVLAASNEAKFGDPILQPGPTDGGVTPADQIAAMERFVRIHFAPTDVANSVDCSTGWGDPAQLDPRIAYLHHGALKTFRLNPLTQTARVGDRVGKSGRTTGLTSGRVANVSATVKVRYGSRVAIFGNQIEIIGLQRPFGAPGDSGSVIWTLDEERHPVGLLFAGGQRSIFANPIDSVLEALDVELLV